MGKKQNKNLANKSNQKAIKASAAPTNIPPVSNDITSNAAVFCPLNEYLKTVLECPVCMDYALPPIWQCHRGHLICNKCRPKVLRCPTCRGHLGCIRNLAMERVTDVIKFSCINKDDGCHAALSWKEKQEHDENCLFAPCKCPTPNTACGWHGNLHGLKQHLRSQHSSIMTVQGPEVTFQANSINLPPPMDWILLQECYGELFVLRLKKVKEDVVKYKAMVHIVATTSNASQYTCLICLKAGDDSLIFDGAAISAVVDAEHVFAYNKGCLTMNEEFAARFISNNSLDLHMKTMPAAYMPFK